MLRYYILITMPSIHHIIFIVKICHFTNLRLELKAKVGLDQIQLFVDFLLKSNKYSSVNQVF